MKKLYKKYRYLFYKLYRLNLWLSGKEDMPSLNAFLFISFFMLFNLATFFLILKCFWKGIEIFSFFSNNKAFLIGILILTLILNYFLLMNNKKSEQIIHEFDNMPERWVKKNDFYLGTYFILTFILFVGLLIYLINNPN